MKDSLNRRDFLIATSMAMAGAAIARSPLSAADVSGKKRGIKKAMMYPNLGITGSVLEKFKALKEAGIEGVEPMSDMDHDEVMKALDTTGLKAASVCCATHWAKPLSDPNPSARETGVEGLKRALRDAKRYGASSVL